MPNLKAGSSGDLSEEQDKDKDSDSDSGFGLSDIIDRLGRLATMPRGPVFSDETQHHSRLRADTKSSF